MYQPPLFREERAEVMHDLIRAHPFAALVHWDDDGLAADHVPLVLHPDLGEFGTLRGHIARPNPLWKRYDPAVQVMAIFQGAQHYITPSWYPSKKEHGKAVPTWNYQVVHAHGPLSLAQDPDWLLAHLQSLTSQHEAGRDEPWAVSDAPDDFVARQLRGIVGFEIPIARLEGKWKLNQNRVEEDRHGVIDGLRSDGTPAAKRMAELIPG